MKNYQSNIQIAKIFHEIGEILKFQNDNPYRIKAYLEAAKFLETYEQEALKLNHKELVALPTIGEDLADMIAEYGKTGFIKRLITLRVEIDSLAQNIADFRQKSYEGKM